MYDCFKKKKKGFIRTLKGFCFEHTKNQKPCGLAITARQKEASDMRVPTPPEEEEPGRTMVSLPGNLPSSLTRPVGSEPCWWCRTETADWSPSLQCTHATHEGPMRVASQRPALPASVVKKEATGSPWAFRGKHRHLGAERSPSQGRQVVGKT